MARRINVRFVFTGLEPCGEQSYWCGPRFGFTGKICTPSLLKIGPCLEERLIILDRAHPAQTAGLPIGSETLSSPTFPCRHSPLRTWAGSQKLPRHRTETYPPQRQRPATGVPGTFGTQPTVYRMQTGRACRASHPWRAASLLDADGVHRTSSPHGGFRGHGAVCADGL